MKLMMVECWWLCCLCINEWRRSGRRAFWGVGVGGRVLTNQDWLGRGLLPWWGGWTARN